MLLPGLLFSIPLFFDQILLRKKCEEDPLKVEVVNEFGENF